MGSVNFPEIDIHELKTQVLTCRVINVHNNVPGVLKQINKLLSDYNITKQSCDSKDALAYFIADVEIGCEDDVQKLESNMNSMRESIISRIL